MTVAELISRLQSEDPEAVVHMAYNYGDHARTTVAPEVTDVDEMTVKFSAYHNMPALAEGDKDGEVVVVIS
jgi:hypothetical protein